MKNYLWSPSKNAFIPAGMVEDYRNAGWDIDELIPVDDAVFAEYSATPPDGKIRGISATGLPEWTEAPQLTADERIALAERKRQTLLAQANEITADWRTELELGMIDDDDKVKLTTWMKYIKAVKVVDTSTAPDVSWPTSPAD
ncbi:tail fiber assembly protein [Enterobacter roggenkampii]|uniref:tail fiber assembly protein n=1 Tax=Enterobacter roggenkampii TaxID=1812935 RepID=UPI001E609771|nr:tail fiber assembly protein [Enterobacter roggenkampii]MCC7581572.1 tail fiber assembly protein [Enterobacter roggenkampii]MCC7591248.1 tail fiber assembly protein [Enterobacter roggenkampii]MCC7595533.1 tail fiber assembly protein [Enterobacter roggenkampii]MCC7605078.1 tail fiber assembly protein [Enterobacter roggenkampii]MCC7610151.1 tail fiber assembly protein [Enterobacter roggenkampii]